MESYCSHWPTPSRRRREKSREISRTASAFIPSGLGQGVPILPRPAATARPPLRFRCTPFNSSLSSSWDPDTWRALGFLPNAGVRLRLEPQFWPARSARAVQGFSLGPREAGVEIFPPPLPARSLARARGPGASWPPEEAPSV